MKLTKIQRYTAYCIMLEEIEQGVFDVGLCSLISYELEMACVYDLRVFRKMFPELYLFRHNAGSNNYWFNNWSERKDAIKTCIKKTHPDNK